MTEEQSKRYVVAKIELSTDGKWYAALPEEQYGQGGCEGWGVVKFGGYASVTLLLQALSALYDDERIAKLKQLIKESENDCEGYNETST
jgi:hypothetical protein